jgi:hypothetical protein
MASLEEKRELGTRILELLIACFFPGKAKLTPVRHLHLISICRSYQPNVYLMSAGAAQALELLFLQNAQQLRLQRGRNIPNFIQEKRAFVG